MAIRKVKVRMQDGGAIGGITGSISIDGGETWVRLTKFVGGGAVAFDNRAQFLKEAERTAKLMMRAP